MAIDLTSINPVFNASIYGNTIGEYTNFLILFFAIAFGLKIFQLYVIRLMKTLSKKTKTKLDDLIIEVFEKIHWPFYVLVSAFFSLRTLVLPDVVPKAFSYIIVLTFTYYVVRGIIAVIDYYLSKEVKRRRDDDGNKGASMVIVLGRIGKALLWVIAFLFLLSNFGVQITPLIASLGIGGLAIAFALQNILSDLFASFSIYFDKPFEEGDFIVLGNDNGVVKHIGIMTTRIQTLQGQELVISNKELTSTRINNYKKMEKRRAVFTFGLTYGTKVAKLKKAKKIVQDVFKSIKIADLDRVHFKHFGDFSLNFEVVYYVNSKEYIDYADTQEEVNLKLKEALEKEKIEMAFPTQTIYLEK